MPRRPLLLQGGAVNQQQFINFVRQRGLAVIATRGGDGAPQAALVGITATGRGELIFDTNRSSCKYRNLSASAQTGCGTATTGPCPCCRGDHRGQLTQGD